MLNEKQKDGLGSANDGFYESKREWLGKRHFILAFERYNSEFLLHCFLNADSILMNVVRNHKGNKQENEECMYYSHPNTDISVISD